MDPSSYRPQSPDLSSYAPQSPDLSGFHQPQSPDLSAALPGPQFGGAYHPQHPQSQFGTSFGNNAFPYAGQPTSVPHFDQIHQPHNIPPFDHFKIEPDRDAKLCTDGPPKRSRKNHQGLPSLDANGIPLKIEHSQLTAPLAGMSTKPRVDPTLGVQLKTSFPVARIKRIMQADEDIGKVAQVTPHVVSRALELFMIKLISASAQQARAAQSTGAGGGGKGPRRILAQHLKKAVQDDETFDFLTEIVGKVPDAPSKAKRDVASDSEEGGGGGAGRVGMKKGKRRKDSGDDF